MYAERSGSQILHGFLPGQTVDLNGGIWKVDEWRTPQFVEVDTATLRSELLRLVGPWEAAKKDGNFAKKLRRGDGIRVHALNVNNGVAVSRFPEIYVCRSCNRVSKSAGRDCDCGSKSFGQLHFIGYHHCGAIAEPQIRRCPQHDQAKIVFPGSTDVSQIKVVCPVCHDTLQTGLGKVFCECGGGMMSFNVHRASSVFTPRSFAVVNPTSPEQIEQMKDDGGPERALRWVVEGCPTGGLAASGVDAQTMLATLLGQGMTEAVAKQMIAIAEEAEEVGAAPISTEIGGGAERASSEATTVYFALSGARRTSDELATELSDGEQAKLLESRHRAGIASVDLLDSFPVLAGHFGYSRGSFTPGETRLKTWTHSRTHQPIVHAARQETEALFIRLDPERVAEWLRHRGHALDDWSDPRSARMSVLAASRLPDPGDHIDADTIGSELLTLVHSFAHRFIRQASVFAGLDRNSLAELLVPSHMGFFVYAHAQGDFVLGGLQAMFEYELTQLLDAFVQGEHRCPMDPACSSAGGACGACLHLGEPSCRYFNRFLDRRTLVGRHGYLS